MQNFLQPHLLSEGAKTLCVYLPVFSGVPQYQIVLTNAGDGSDNAGQMFTQKRMAVTSCSRCPAPAPAPPRALPDAGCNTPPNVLLRRPRTPAMVGAVPVSLRVPGALEGDPSLPAH